MYLTFLLASLACFRLTRLVSEDKITQWLREKLVQSVPRTSKKIARQGITCAFCISFYIALLITCYLCFLGLLEWKLLPLWQPAIWGASILANEVFVFLTKQAWPSFFMTTATEWYDWVDFHTGCPNGKDHSQAMKLANKYWIQSGNIGKKIAKIAVAPSTDFLDPVFYKRWEAMFSQLDKLDIEFENTRRGLMRCCTVHWKYVHQ